MALEEKLYGKCYFTFYGIISVMLRRQCLASNVGLMLMFLSLHRFASHLIVIICNVLAACFENLVNHTSIQLIWRHNCIFIYKKTSSGSFYFHFNWWFIYKLYVENIAECTLSPFCSQRFDLSNKFSDKTQKRKI